MAVRTHPRNSSRGSICWHGVCAISPAENLSWNRVRTGSSVYYWVFTWVTPSSYCTANHLAARKCSNNKTRRKKVGFGSAFTTHSDSDWSSHFLVPFSSSFGRTRAFGRVILVMGRTFFDFRPPDCRLRGVDGTSHSNEIQGRARARGSAGQGRFYSRTLPL